MKPTMNALPSLAIFLAPCLMVCALQAVTVPRVAVWDPQKPTGHPRVELRADQLDRAAAVLERAGISVARLDADALADASRFDADHFDLVLFPGEVVPKPAIPALRRFADAGGVLMNLGGKVPFVNRIDRRADGAWTVSPADPAFAWQTPEVHNLFGIRYRYDPRRHDQARRFEVTPLLARYLPVEWQHDGVLENWWLPSVEREGGRGTYFPLVRSRRADGADVTPQLAIVRSGKRHAILCLNAFFTDGSRPELWPHADALLPALAALARDLREGRLELPEEQRVDVPEDLAPPAPLRGVPDGPGVSPEAAISEPLARFGRFNDSSLDLDGGPLPPTLAPGAAVTLDLPALPADGAPLVLRVRAAYEKSGAGLRLSLGERVLHNEIFLLPDASGVSNHSTGAYEGLAATFTRLVFVPPDAAAGGGPLTVANPGAEPVHFDALQIERRTGEGPLRWIGQYAGFRSSMPDGINTIPTDITRRWSVMRCDLRGQFIGAPGDPNRWDALRRHLDKFAAMNSRWNLIFMGTPEWAAVSPERYADGKRAGRAHCVPPDAEKYAEIVEWTIRNYDAHIAVYEIWNETDIQTFWRGTTDEYLAFAGHIAAVVRRLAPDKPVILAGPAGFRIPYLQTVLPTDLSKGTDWVPLHCYAAQSVGWDLPYGLLQGLLYQLGLDQEIYSNESGFPWKPGEWFRDPGWSPEAQARSLSAASARLFANGIAKHTYFLAGGDEHLFGVYDPEGHPRPGAAVIDDYLQLALNEGRRLDLAATDARGLPLQGVYAVGSIHADGSVTLVLDPAEVPGLQPVPPPPDSTFDAAEASGWTTFWGSTEWVDGTAKVTLDAGRDRCGFYRRALLDPNRHPEIEVVVSEAAGPWTLQLKFGDGDEPMVFSENGPGVFRAEYASKLKSRAARTVEISFRATRPLALDGLRFIGAPAGGDTPQVPVRVVFGLPGGGDWQAAASAGGPGVAVDLAVRESGNQHWAEVTLGLTGRTLVRVARKGGEAD